MEHVNEHEQEQQYLYRPRFGNEADIARLTAQYGAIVQTVHLFPGTYTPRKDETVLDIACGPGNWARDVAWKYPEMSVIGLDSDADAVQHAMRLAWLGHIENVTFERHDVTTELPFSDGSVDYVNMSLCNSFLLRDQWSTLFAECHRVLRPGGWLRSLEWMGVQSSSWHIHQIAEYYAQALANEGKRYIEIAPHLRTLLEQGGFAISAPLMVHAIDFSWERETHKPLADDWYIGAQLARPFVAKYTDVSEAHLVTLAEEMQRDMMLPGFYALLLLSDISAQKAG